MNFHEKILSFPSGMASPAAAGDPRCRAGQASAAAVPSTPPPRRLLPVHQEPRLATSPGRLSREAQATGCRGREGSQAPPPPQLPRTPAGRCVLTSSFTPGRRGRKGSGMRGVCVARKEPTRLPLEPRRGEAFQPLPHTQVQERKRAIKGKFSRQVENRGEMFATRATGNRLLGGAPRDPREGSHRSGGGRQEQLHQNETNGD